jgi:hypothetical protein
MVRMGVKKSAGPEDPKEGEEGLGPGDEANPNGWLERLKAVVIEGEIRC